MAERSRRAARVIRLQAVGSSDFAGDVRPDPIPTGATTGPHPSFDGSTWVDVTYAGNTWAQETPESWDRRHGISTPGGATRDNGTQTGSNGDAGDTGNQDTYPGASSGDQLGDGDSIGSDNDQLPTTQQPANNGQPSTLLAGMKNPWLWLALLLLAYLVMNDKDKRE